MDKKNMTAEQYLDFRIDRQMKKQKLYNKVFLKLVEYKYFTNENLREFEALMYDEFKQECNVELLNKAIRARYNDVMNSHYDEVYDWIELFENAFEEGKLNINSWDEFMAEFKEFDDLIDW